MAGRSCHQVADRALCATLRRAIVDHFKTCVLLVQSKCRPIAVSELHDYYTELARYTKGRIAIKPSLN